MSATPCFDEAACVLPKNFCKQGSVLACVLGRPKPYIRMEGATFISSITPARRSSLDCCGVRPASRRRSLSHRDCTARCSWQQPPPDHQDQHGPQLPAKPRHARSIQAAVAHRASTVYERLLTQLTPQARGDRTDCILMSASVSVLVLLAMQMFRLYLHWYQTTGLRPIFHSFPTHW